MSFPNYSTFFKLGLGQGCSGQEQQKKKERKRPLRSFLKLDLVDAPAAHYPSVEPASPVPSCSSSPTSSPYLHPSPALSHMTLPNSSLVHRRSRDSLRTIPSPKPAPSAGLPHAPTPSFDHPSPASVDSTPEVTPTRPFTSESALGLHNMDPVRPVSAYSAAGSSVASPRRRLVSRTQALAFLEGRGPSRPSKPRARNFMSMSDDEDEDADDEDNADVDAPTPLATLAPSSRPFLFPASAPALNLSFLSLAKARPLSTASLPASTTSRNFIDFCADWDAEDEQRPLSLSPAGTLDFGHWRSFIEIEMAGGA